MSLWLYTSDHIPDGYGMGTFSPGHLFWLAVSLLIFIFIGRMYRDSDEKRRTHMRWILAVLMIVDEIYKDVLTITTGQWLWEYLPLHLCSISIFMAFIYTATGNRLVEEYLYAVSLPTATMALVFPDWMNLPFLNLMNFHSFTIHIMIVLYPVMLLYGGFRPDTKYLFRLIPFIVLYGFLIYFVNQVLDTNFFFMNGAAEGNPLSVLEKYVGGWYRAAFPVIALIVWLPMYYFPSRALRRQTRP